jgi:hypothetical protein
LLIAGEQRLGVLPAARCGEVLERVMLSLCRPLPAIRAPPIKTTRVARSPRSTATAATRSMADRVAPSRCRGSKSVPDRLESELPLASSADPEGIYERQALVHAGAAMRQLCGLRIQRSNRASRLCSRRRLGNGSSGGRIEGPRSQPYVEGEVTPLAPSGAGHEAAPRGRPLLLPSWVMRQAGTLRFPRRWRATCSARKTFMSD